MVTSRGTQSNSANQTVMYNGRRAVIQSAPQNSRYWTVVIDGKPVKVDKNDLFGLNNKRITEQFASQKSFYDDVIEKSKKTIKEAKGLWSAAVETMKSCRNQMYTILRDAKVTNFNQISDAEQRKKYQALATDRSSARMTQIRATSDIIGAAIDVGSAVSGKMNVIGQEMVAKHIMGLA